MSSPPSSNQRAEALPPQQDAQQPKEQASKISKSLNGQIRSILLECPSLQSLFERIMQISLDQFPATVARVDFTTGDQHRSRMQHNTRMAKSLAQRFSDEYMAVFARELLTSGEAEPRLKQFERGNQTMTLIAAPILDIAAQKTEGVITLMLGGGSHKPEVMLPRLDSIAAVASTVLVVKGRSGSVQKAARSGQTQPANVTATAPAHTSPTPQATSTARPSVHPAAARANPADNPAPQPTAIPPAPISSASHADTIAKSSALAKASQFGSTKEFGFSIVNSLCGQLQAEQVAFGVENHGRVTVEAISGFPDFKANSPGVAITRQAMEECVDNGNFTVAQQEQLEEVDSLPIHRQWAAESNNSCVCSIPLRQGDDITGVISIRRPASRPFKQEDVASLLQLLSPYGGAIRVVEKANRSMGTQLKSAVSESARSNLGKGKTGRKFAWGVLALGVLWFLFGTLTYRPICRTRVIAANLRHFAAPFDGKLSKVMVKPGQQVKSGDMLAEFDTADLRLELNSLIRQISTTQVEVRQAISDNDLPLATLSKSRVGVLQTQAQAISKRILDARITAPHDGTVVLADLAQRVGQVFPQGEEILQLAIDGEWLLEIEVPDDIANYVSIDQTGTFAAASHPTEKQSFKINNIDGAATLIDDRNVFIATAPLESKPDWMKTGMEGTARVMTTARPVWWVSLHRVVDWARMNFWI